MMPQRAPFPTHGSFTPTFLSEDADGLTPTRLPMKTVRRSLYGSWTVPFDWRPCLGDISDVSMDDADTHQHTLRLLCTDSLGNSNNDACAHVGLMRLNDMTLPTDPQYCDGVTSLCFRAGNDFQKSKLLSRNPQAPWCQSAPAFHEISIIPSQFGHILINRSVCR